MLYEMVGNRRAFAGANAVEVRNAILHEESAPLSAVSLGAPPELVGIINKALKKEPAERYQTAGDMLFDLKGVQSAFGAEVKLGPSPDRVSRELANAIGRGPDTGQSETATSASSAEILLDAIKRRKTLAAVAVLALIAIAITFSFYLSKGNKTQITSIAVLPFVNTSGDQNTDYFTSM